MIESGRPLIIAHRGASGHRPEHTLAAYDLAIDLGADFIEPDHVATRDGVLVARHENVLAMPGGEATTDVADHPEFAERLATKVIDGVEVTGWFTEDFTLAEVKTLRTRQRLPHLRSAAFDDRWEIPTLAEVLELARRRSGSGGRPIGVYPETKHPSYFASIGLPLEEPLVEALRRSGYDDRASTFIQSFEAWSLRRLCAMTDVPLVFLLNAGPALDPAGVTDIATFASALGLHKDLVIPRDADGRLLAPTRRVDDAHAAGLAVHVWTFRDEPEFLPRDCSPAAELRAFLDLGVDGLFTDHPATARAAIDAAVRRRSRR